MMTENQLDELEHLRTFYKRVKKRSLQSVVTVVAGISEKIRRQSRTEEERFLTNIVCVPTLRRFDDTCANPSIWLFRKKLLKRGR